MEKKIRKERERIKKLMKKGKKQTGYGIEGEDWWAG